MLEAQALTKRYNGVTALDALTLTVAPGDVFCLLGANGAGKTTTINLFPVRRRGHPVGGRPASRPRLRSRGSGRARRARGTAGGRAGAQG